MTRRRRVPASSGAATTAATGFVSILNRFSNKVAEVAACVNAEGARVAQWGWLNNDCQQFHFASTGDGWCTIQSKLNGRVLQPAGCGGVGAAIQTATANGSACQQFRIQPVGNVLIADAAMHQLCSPRFPRGPDDRAAPERLPALAFRASR